MSQDLVYRLRKRAEIRRNIATRKSVQEGKPDRLADLLEEAADEIDRLASYQTKGPMNKLVFYPKDLPIWGDRFCFTNDITLTPKAKTDHVVLNDHGELFDLLKECGVVMTDPLKPVQLIRSVDGDSMKYWRMDPHDVIQGDQVFGSIALQGR
jgi:hypothetical protein